MIRICFVCLGNICRSPTAEGIMIALLKKAKIESQFEIDSAGTAAYHEGERADPRSRATAISRGTPLVSIARQFRQEDFERFDWIIAMDQNNARNLLQIAQSTEYEKKVFLLRSFSATPLSDSCVPDPYYGGEGGFEEVYDICEEACQGLLKQIALQHGLSTPQ